MVWVLFWEKGRAGKLLKYGAQMDRQVEICFVNQLYFHNSFENGRSVLTVALLNRFFSGKSNLHDLLI